MSRKLPFSYLGAALSGLAFGVLAACQQHGSTDYIEDQHRLGAERLQACIAVQCERLDLDGARLVDYSVLNDLTHITALMISYTDFSDLGQIAGMTQLTELHIGSSQVTDLSGLSAFPNLRVLHAQSLDAGDLSPIAQLRGLRELAIGSYEPYDLADIASMRSVETLLISYAPGVLDLSPLASMTGLRRLDLSSTYSESLAPLENIPRLQSLAFSDEVPLDGARLATVERLRARGVDVQFDMLVIVC